MGIVFHPLATPKQPGGPFFIGTQVVQWSDVEEQTTVPEGKLKPSHFWRSGEARLGKHNMRGHGTSESLGWW